MIVLENVRAGYGGHEVLDGVDLSVSPGEFVGLLGPNGSGKTTLIRVLSGVLPMDSGKARIQGKNIDSFQSKCLARIVATVPQQVDTLFGLKVETLVRLGRYPWLPFLGSFGPEDRQAVDQAIRMTGLEHLAHRPVSRLSGGEQQRVLVARALAQQTPLLLLDEAASHLDPARRMAIFDLLAGLHAQGRTILAVVHDLNLAALYCRRLVFIKQGQIILEGLVEDVFTKEALEQVYETEIRITTHPVTGRPQAFLVPGHPRGPAGLAHGRAG